MVLVVFKSISKLSPQNIFNICFNLWKYNYFQIFGRGENIGCKENFKTKASRVISCVENLNNQ